MLDTIKNRISAKLIIAIVIIVTLSSMLLFLYLNRINTQKMYKNLDHTIGNISDLLKMAYAIPILDYDEKGVRKLNKGILNIQEVVAINVYDEMEFLSGRKKTFKNLNVSNFIYETIFTPFKISKDETWLYKKKIPITHNGEKMGYLEIFYTKQFILQNDKTARINMGISLIILAFIIIFSIHILMKKLVITPITILSSETQKIAENKEYLPIVQKNGNDEIAKLYTGFNDMLSQLKVKDVQREKVVASLKESDENYSYLFTKLQNAVNNSDYSRVEDFNSDSNSDRYKLILSLNTFLKTLERSDTQTKQNNWLKTGQTTLSNAISGEINLNKLCNNAINHIANYLNAQVGTLYVKELKNKVKEPENNDSSNDKIDQFRLYASYAFKRQKGFSDKFKFGEGLAGQAALEKKHIILSNIQNTGISDSNASDTDDLKKEIEKTYLTVESSIKSLVPNNIFIFPLIYENDVKGVIELGSFTEFTPDMVEFAKLSGNIIAVAINIAIMMNNKIK